MKKIAVLVMLLTFGATASPAFGQATRTWVSNDTGLGDDANPCSRSAPCRTFAGAISKTNIGGEIDVLDDGGYGTLSITKSITIDGGGHVASVLASGSSFGMSIRIPGGNPNDPNRRVVLRNLTLNGTGTVSGTIGENTGLVGVSVNTDGARSVELDNVRIANFLQHGVKVTPNPLFPSQLDMVLRNVVVADTGTNPGGVPGNAFEIRPTDGAHQVNALIADSELRGSHAGPGRPPGSRASASRLIREPTSGSRTRRSSPTTSGCRPSAARVRQGSSTASATTRLSATQTTERSRTRRALSVPRPRLR